MNEAVKELVAIGASVGAHGQPCLEHHIRTATRLGVSPEDIHEAITIGHTVENGTSMVGPSTLSEFLGWTYHVWNGAVFGWALGVLDRTWSRPAGPAADPDGQPCCRP